MAKKRPDAWLDKAITEATCAESDALKAVRRTVRALLARGASKAEITRRVCAAAPPGVVRGAIESIIAHEAGEA